MVYLKSLKEKLHSRITDLKLNLSWHLNYPLIPPKSLTLKLTNKCNLNCVYCFGYNRRKIYPEMSFNEIKKTLQNAKKIGIQMFNPLGGEIFMRKDTLDIIKYAQDMKFSTTITTNGTLFDKTQIHKLVSYAKDGLFAVLFSLDGFNKEENDRVRGDGTFDKIISNIKIMNKERKLKKKTMFLGMNTVVTNNNLKNLTKMINLGKLLGVDSIQFITCTITSKQVRENMKEMNLFITPKDFNFLDKTINTLLMLKKREKDIKIANDSQSLNNFKTYYRRQYYNNEKFIKE